MNSAISSLLSLGLLATATLSAFGQASPPDAAEPGATLIELTPLPSIEPDVEVQQLFARLMSEMKSPDHLMNIDGEAYFPPLALSEETVRTIKAFDSIEFIQQSLMFQPGPEMMDEILWGMVAGQARSIVRTQRGQRIEAAASLLDHSDSTVRRRARNALFAETSMGRLRDYDFSHFIPVLHRTSNDIAAHLAVWMFVSDPTGAMESFNTLERQRDPNSIEPEADLRVRQISHELFSLHQRAVVQLIGPEEWRAMPAEAEPLIDELLSSDRWWHRAAVAGLGRSWGNLKPEMWTALRGDPDPRVRAILSFQH